MGTCLVWSYIALKIVIIMNAALQLHLIQVFLGFTGHYIKPAPVDSLIQGKTQYPSGKLVSFVKDSKITCNPLVT